MMKRFGLLVAAALMVATPHIGQSHCQIPCGIYGDDARFVELYEHVKTIRKSIVKIKELSKGEDKNQLVRWVLNKEVHADKVSDIAHKYFLAQRIKEGSTHYVDNLKSLHKIVVYAMKTKQSLDTANVDKLEAAIKALQEKYGHKH